MIPLWKGKNPIYFGVITIMLFDNLYRQTYFVMHTFLVIIMGKYNHRSYIDAFAIICFRFYEL
jgi:hypothetical protein